MGKFYRMIRPALAFAVVLWLVQICTAQRLALGPANTGTETIKGLHLDGGLPDNSGRATMFSDGGGYQWDIDHNGGIGSNTVYMPFTGSFRLNINGQEYYGSGSRIINKSAGELETAAANLNGLRISRRVKVYDRAPLIRYLEIFENDQDRNVEVMATITVSMNWGLEKMLTDSGLSSPGQDDTAIIWQYPNVGMPNPVRGFCSIYRERSGKILPQFSKTQNQSLFRWKLSIPAGGKAVLCHFAAQARSVGEHDAMIRNFRSNDYLLDLPSRVRRLIVNFRSADALELDLNRSIQWDRISLTNGDQLMGSAMTKSYDLQTATCGQLKLDSGEIVGGKRMVNRDDFQVLLADGQIVLAACPSGSLEFKLEDGDTLAIPFDQISEWSYRISETRPAELQTSAAYVTLRNGQKLEILCDQTRLYARTSAGPGSVDLADVADIEFDNRGNSLHAISFRNGSSLSCIIEPAQIAFKLKSGRLVILPREQISSIQAASAFENSVEPHTVDLTNRDTLYGSLKMDKSSRLRLVTEFGPVEIPLEQIKQASAVGLDYERFRLDLSDGTTNLVGYIDQRCLQFVIGSKTVLPLAPQQMSRLLCSFHPCDEKTEQKISQLVEQLGSEDWNKRQDASARLKRLGLAAVPILRTHLANPDLEIRQRIEEVIRTTLASSKTPPTKNP